MAQEWPDVFTIQALPFFEKHLLPLAGKDGLKFLQLGVAAGDASAWMLDNVLTGKGSRLVDVDLWEGLTPVAESPEVPPMPNLDFERIWQDYQWRIAYYSNVTVRRLSTTEYLRRCPTFFDFIYVDASHDSWNVLSDAVLASYVLKAGGLLAFDDCKWPTVRTALSHFLDVAPPDLAVIDEGTQLWLRSNQ